MAPRNNCGGSDLSSFDDLFSMPSNHNQEGINFDFDFFDQKPQKSPAPSASYKPAVIPENPFDLFDTPSSSSPNSSNACLEFAQSTDASSICLNFAHTQDEWESSALSPTSISTDVYQERSAPKQIHNPAKINTAVVTTLQANPPADKSNNAVHPWSDQKRPSQEYAFDDEEDAMETYRQGLKGDHGQTRKPTMIAMNPQQAALLAKQKGIGSKESVGKHPYHLNHVTGSPNRKTKTADSLATEELFFQEYSRRHSPKTTLTTVAPMTANEAAAKFKAKFGDPKVEKEKRKALEKARKEANKLVVVDPKQDPSKPKRKSDPIRSALGKPKAVQLGMIQSRSALQSQATQVEFNSFV